MPKLTKAWFDHLEDVLTREAEQAGLLEHGSMTGSAREFFIARVLRSILPSSVHIGAGRIIGEGGNQRSKQIDVIVYDPRFPLMEVQPGVGLYFAEGVIASIEVKSTLTHKSLRDALNNCASASEMLGHVQDYRDMDAAVAEMIAEERLGRKDAAHRLLWSLSPRTYIFAYTSRIGPNAAATAVNKWFEARGSKSHPQQPQLPRIIALPSAVGVQDDGWLRLTGKGFDEAEVGYGPTARRVFAFWHTERRFGFLALHLMHACAERLGLLHWGNGVRFTIDQHLPLADYMAAIDRRKEIRAIFWEPKSSSGKT